MTNIYKHFNYFSLEMTLMVLRQAGPGKVQGIEELVLNPTSLPLVVGNWVKERYVNLLL